MKKTSMDAGRKKKVQGREKGQKERRKERCVCVILSLVDVRRKTKWWSKGVQYKGVGSSKSKEGGLLV